MGLATGSGAAVRTLDAGSDLADPVARAHQALLRHHDLQFDLAAAPVAQTPEWLKALARWLGHLVLAAAPALKLVFWAGLAFGGACILYFIIREIVLRVRPGLVRAKLKVEAAESEWRPTQAKALTLLEDADRLAAEGRFGEAAHLILFRSIEDIDRRWPNLVRPALTSRDIAEHPGLPAQARDTFAGIAQRVERSLFGGRVLAAEDFAACRQAYAAFAFPARP